MQRIATGTLAVERGARLLFSDHQDNGPMWTGQGARTSRVAVRFSAAYRRPPIVHVSIGMWDISGSENQRADITAENVTEDGFEIVFRTWGDTRVARIRAEWLSIGQMANEDDFRL